MTGFPDCPGERLAHEAGDVETEVFRPSIMQKVRTPDGVGVCIGYDLISDVEYVDVSFEQCRTLLCPSRLVMKSYQLSEMVSVWEYGSKTY